MASVKTEKVVTSTILMNRKSHESKSFANSEFFEGSRTKEQVIAGAPATSSLIGSSTFFGSLLRQAASFIFQYFAD